MSWRKRVLPVLAAVLFISFSAGFGAANDRLPPLAVAGFNYHVTAQAGWLDDPINATGMAAVSGSWATPVGNNFGFQHDMLLAFSHGEFGGGMAGHGFWRDPNVGLVGVYLQWIARHQPNWKTWRAGIEVHKYLGRWSFDGIVGYEVGLTHWDEPRSDLSSVFVLGNARYYFMDNLMVSGGYRYLNKTHIGALDIAYQPETQWLPIVWGAHVRAGQDEYLAAWVSATLNFNQIGTLLERHRRYQTFATEDDSIFQHNPNILARR